MGRKPVLRLLLFNGRVMFAVISIGQILAILVTLNLIALSIAAFVILRRK
jgi:hypothetical protein